MARKPVLIELLLVALGEVGDAFLQDPARVYLYSTNSLLLRNIDTRRTFTSTSDKLYFLCELAWEMVSTGELRIHYSSLPKRISAYFGARIKDSHELDAWDFDLRNQTLLHRDAAGYYEFAHKSLAEYFAAYRLVAELGCLSPVFAETYCGGDEEPTKNSFSRRNSEGLGRTFGCVLLDTRKMGAVTDFMLEMMGPNAEDALWAVIDGTRGKTFEEVGFSGSNAAMLLCERTESLKGQNLAGAVLVGADLGADLRATDFSNANLHQVQLRGADLRGANLEGTVLDEGSLVSADLVGALGLGSRFLRFASDPIPHSREPIGKLLGRARQCLDISATDRLFEPCKEAVAFKGFLSSEDSPFLWVVNGPSGTGKTTLLASVARQSREIGREVFWFNGSATKGGYMPFGPWDLRNITETGRKAVWWRSLSMFTELSTFLTVAGYDLLSRHIRELIGSAMAPVTPDIEENIFGIVFQAFEKEKWLITLDDVSFEPWWGDRLGEFFAFLSPRPMSTRVLVSTPDPEPPLLKDVAYLRLERVSA